MRNVILLAVAAVVAMACESKKKAQPVPQKEAHDAGPVAPPPSGAPLDPARIEQLTGAKGKLDDKSGVFKVSVPRRDLTVTIAGGVKMSPPMGLTAWAAFQPMGDHVMVMGDIVMTEDQVNVAMSAALDSGLDVTALHNHFLWDAPKVMFMHIAGMGDQAELATAVGTVFAAMEDRGATPKADIDPAKSTLDPAKLDAALGTKGDFKDGVYKATFGRTTKMGGTEVGGTMGVNTWAAFAGSADAAVVDGDVAMLESVQTVLKTLRKAGINIVAIHQHMTGEEPRIMFLHYWGLGKAEDLARALKRALDTQRP